MKRMTKQETLWDLVRFTRPPFGSQCSRWVDLQSKDGEDNQEGSKQVEQVGNTQRKA